MAKRAGASAPTTWLAEYLCGSRGCGQAHPVCVTGKRKPAGDDWFAYTCPMTRKPTGLRFGDVPSREVSDCPKGRDYYRRAEAAAGLAPHSGQRSGVARRS